MTIEEAIRIIKIVLAIAEDFEITVQGEELTEEKCKEAVEIVTKTLEQHSTTKNVLIQLKDEIHDKGFNSPLMNPIFTYTEILEMIDKYITDIELQESE